MSDLPEIFARVSAIVPELKEEVQWRDSQWWPSQPSPYSESLIIAACVRWLLKQPATITLNQYAADLFRVRDIGPGRDYEGPSLTIALLLAVAAHKGNNP